MNLDKCEVSFGRNIEQDKKLKFKVVKNQNRFWIYLLTLENQKSLSYNPRSSPEEATGWKENFLSKTGREILKKLVAQAIPTCTMQCFALPNNILHQIEILCRSFY